MRLRYIVLWGAFVAILIAVNLVHGWMRWAMFVTGLAFLALMIRIAKTD